MNKEELKETLNTLLARGESETVEFKGPRSSKFDTKEIGKYVSALANEANLRQERRAWLVFGIDDTSCSLVGTTYRQDAKKLQHLNTEILENTQPKLTFRKIHDLEIDGHRVIMFEIPAAPRGMPVAWSGQYYGRAGESRVLLTRDKEDEIRGQSPNDDWTAQTVEAATFDDLDPAALTKACAGGYSQWYCASGLSARWADSRY